MQKKLHLQKSKNLVLLATLVISAGFVGYMVVRGFTAPELTKVPIPAKGTYWSFSVTGADEDKITNFENFTNRHPMNGYHWFKNYPDAVPTQDIKDSQAQGRIPLMNWKIGDSWATVANGGMDSYIDQRADAIKAWGKPIIIAYHHEPENDSSAGTKAEYRAAFRHVVERFRAKGVNNVSFAWIMMGWSFNPSSGENVNGVIDYYPGDDVVDWIMGDIYNWFGRDGKWTELSKASAAFIKWATVDKAGDKNKPLGLTEWGAVEDPASPGRKAQWLRNAVAWMKTVPNLKWSSYFSNVHNNNGITFNWTIDSSQSSIDAWREISADPHFNPTPTTPPVDAPPAIPLDFALVVGDGQITTSWTANTESDFDHYEIRYKPISTTQWTTIGNVEGVSNLISGLVNDTAYEFAILAVDKAGNKSAYSTSIQGTPQAIPTPPAIPVGLRAVVGDAEVTLSWNPNIEPDLESYAVRYKAVSSTQWTWATNITQPTTVVTGLINGTDHEFQVRAIDKTGNKSEYSNSITATPKKNSRKGDVNNDAKIDVFDLSLLLSKWNTGDSIADLNSDGTVNIFDLSILLSNWD